MHELKCPKCGSVFTVDEADYASIVSQVRGTEFNAEVQRRLAELHAQYEAEPTPRSSAGWPNCMRSMRPSSGRRP